MRRVLGFVVLFSLLTGAVLLLGGCGGGSTATTGPPASTSAGSAPMITASPPTTTASMTTMTAPATTAASTATTGTSGAATGGNPIPIGAEAGIGDWKIKVTSADLDADAAVKNAPGYQPPDPGSRYVLVNLDATYLGVAPDSFSNGLGYQIVGSKGDTFDSVNIGLDKSIENTDAVLNGVSISGSLVFEVPSDQIDGAMLWMARSSSGEETGTLFALK